MTEEPLYIKITPEPNEDEREVILKAFKELWPKDEKDTYFIQMEIQWKMVG